MQRTLFPLSHCKSSVRKGLSVVSRMNCCKSSLMVSTLTSCITAPVEFTCLLPISIDSCGRTATLTLGDFLKSLLSTALFQILSLSFPPTVFSRVPDNTNSNRFVCFYCDLNLLSGTKLCGEYSKTAETLFLETCIMSFVLWTDRVGWQLECLERVLVPL